MDIQFKTSLCNFEKGQQPCYIAHAIMHDRIPWEDVVTQIANNVGVKKSVVRFVIDELKAVIQENLAACNRVSIEGICDISLTVKGSFDTADAPFDPAKNRINIVFQPKGAMRTVFNGVTAKNTTEGNRCRVTSVLDTVAKTEGKIQARDDEDPVVVYAAGGTFLVNTEAEDEGVWLEDLEGTVAVRGIVTASTATTLNCEFDELPEPGNYRFVVATRGGLGEGYGVSIAKRDVEVLAAPEG